MDIRSAQPGDVSRIAEIYAYYVEHTVVTFATDAPAPADWAQRIRSAAESGHPFLVGEQDGRVIGFALLQPWNPKPAYRLTTEDSVYVDRDALGAGHGRRLLTTLLDEGRAAGFRHVIAIISDTATGSAKLHRDLGFRSAGQLTEVGYKHHRWIDVDILQLDLHRARQTAL